MSCLAAVAERPCGGTLSVRRCSLPLSSLLCSPPTHRYYTNLCDRLTAQVNALNLSLAREQQLRDAARDAQLLLAEAILNHKVLYQMLGPLQRQWMQQQQQQGVNGTTSASSATLPQHCSTPVQLACQTNPLLRALVMVRAHPLARRGEAMCCWVSAAVSWQATAPPLHKLAARSLT